MEAHYYLDPSVPTLKATDSIEYAHDLMAEFKAHQLPLVENEQYKGIISDELIQYGMLTANSLADVEALYPSLVAHPDYHLLEVARMAHDYKLDIVAVTGDKGEYLGVVPVKQAAASLVAGFSIQSQGAILVLSMDFINYSLAEISRLVETNQAKIISSYVTPSLEEPGKVAVTLRLNTSDLTRVIATFERFQYSILAKYHDHETKNYESQRIDLLLKYLEI
jgi:hypothetical protein